MSHSNGPLKAELHPATYGQAVVRNAYDGAQSGDTAVLDFKTYNLVKTMNPDTSKPYGKQSKPRAEDPSMFDLISGGYDHPVEHDFKKSGAHLAAKLCGSIVPADCVYENRTNVRHGIRKCEDKYVSETADNFRSFVRSPDKGELLVNFADQCWVDEAERESAHYDTTYDATYEDHFQTQ